ncbi:MAG: histidine phosphatase family protein, partial [Bacteroidia bacterium]|nr:histidine phosphatase family protein [Bacteroidia bacterium]
LKGRGIKDAYLVSQAFKSTDFKPDSIYSSPANRAYSTCKIFIKNLNYSPEKVEQIGDLYDFGGNRVLSFLKSLEDNKDKVMIFGHNHAFTYLTNSLGDRYIDNLPTSGLVQIEMAIDSWAEIAKGHIVKAIFPRDLK